MFGLFLFSANKYYNIHVNTYECFICISGLWYLVLYQTEFSAVQTLDFYYISQLDVY